MTAMNVFVCVVAAASLAVNITALWRASTAWGRLVQRVDGLKERSDEHETRLNEMRTGVLKVGRCPDCPLNEGG